MWREKNEVISLLKPQELGGCFSMTIENGVNRDKPFPNKMKIKVIATYPILGTNEIEVK
jgi:hypothetical protein